MFHQIDFGQNSNPSSLVTPVDLLSKLSRFVVYACTAHQCHRYYKQISSLTPVDVEVRPWCHHHSRGIFINWRLIKYVGTAQAWGSAATIPCNFTRYVMITIWRVILPSSHVYQDFWCDTIPYISGYIICLVGNLFHLLCQFTSFNSAMAWTPDTQLSPPRRCQTLWVSVWWVFETMMTSLLQLQMDCAKFDITNEEESWIGEK